VTATRLTWTSASQRLQPLSSASQFDTMLAMNLPSMDELNGLLVKDTQQQDTDSRRLPRLWQPAT
jgi:hypothetical protein